MRPLIGWQDLAFRALACSHHFDAEKIASDAARGYTARRLTATALEDYQAQKKIFAVLGGPLTMQACRKLMPGRKGPKSFTISSAIGKSKSLTLSLLFCTVLAVANWSSCEPKTGTASGNDGLARTLSSATLRVGYVVFPPTVIKDPTTQKLSGHFIDTIEYIASELGVKVEYQEVTWATFAAGLNSKRYDVAVAGTYITIPRAKTLSFTRPIFYLGNAVVVKKGENRFHAPLDLNKADLNIALTQGTGEHDYAQRYLSKAKLDAISSPDLTLPLLEVLNGRADVAISDTYTVSEFVRRHAGLDVLFLDKPFNLTAVAWAVRRDDRDLLDVLNNSLLYLELSGRLREFENKYQASWFHQKYTWE